ncbi:MAG: S8 family serine peptidase, partial [Bdellovibrionales bacterium]
ILPIKVGAGSGVDVASLSGAIRYAVDNGAKILNMSLGFSSDFKVISDAIKYAEDHNVLIVAAAGNETNNNDLVPNFPSNYKNKNVLAVAATDEKDNLTEYSNFGQSVHIAAPGGTPNKPIISSYKKNPRNAQFVGLMGTSMSTPLVVGIAAQVWGANPNLSALQVKEILIKTGRPSKNLEGKILSGKVVDAMAAITAALAYDKTTGLQSSAQP